MKIGTKEFDVTRTHVMGILNVTPDSFSDGGKWNHTDRALKHAEQMIAEGAEVLDIGGESTRPGFTEVAEAEEMERVLPVIERIRNNFDIPLSIDTYKSNVAGAALRAGADLVNDIWGLKHDPEMAQVIAETKAACCLMHNRRDMHYRQFMQDLVRELKESVSIAKAAETYENNLEALRCLGQLREAGYPVLLGASRKSVIGLTLGLPVEERLEGTLALTVLAVQAGCAFVRVHDVKENVRAVRMAEAVAGQISDDAVQAGDFSDTSG